MKKFELRMMIKHSFLMGKNTVQAKQWFDKFYPASAPSRQIVMKWFADFKHGRTNTDDAERSGHPNSALVPVVPGNIKKVHKMFIRHFA